MVMGTEHQKVKSVTGAVFMGLAGGICLFMSLAFFSMFGLFGGTFGSHNPALFWLRMFFNLALGIALIVFGTLAWNGHLTHQQLFYVAIADFVVATLMFMSMGINYLNEIFATSAFVIPFIVVAGVFFITTPKPKRPSYTFDEPAPKTTPKK